MKKLLMFGTIVPALFLAGCGDGYEMRPYHNTPYGDRTAGSGVEYVRAHMMQEKGPVIKAEQPKLEPIVAPPPAEPVVETKPDPVDNLIGSGEKFFRDLQKK